MGYGVKNGLDLDLTYKKIINPCLVDNKLVPFPLYEEKSYNAFRCDEISGTTSIDYKFVTCLNGADIVVADISTMNVNAIYELGARHALKPRSTILLCAKDKEKEFNFFDITYVPIIFYEHNGTYLKDDVISNTKKQLNKLLDFSINASTEVPDNPIYRALNEKNVYDKKHFSNQNIYQLYKKGRNELDNNEFDQARDTLDELYSIDPTEENLLLLVLAKYKIAENKNSCKDLIECLNFIKQNVDVDNSTSEYLYGRLAAICLRIYNISNESEYYYSALEYYRRGANFCKKNLYCPRNYCALLLRIYEITEDKNVIAEYYYTAKHFAKLYLNITVNVKDTGSFDERIYYTYNTCDLKAIIADEYRDYEKMINRIENDLDISKRQKSTLLEGIAKLKESIEQINSYLKKV
ncbi:MAG: hypothetical protein U0L56_03300 [Lachnospiraceae bacterium]|nr:hypothetical protein [Lachnospiraceae bacterium]